jgi:hypothetical protein
VAIHDLVLKNVEWCRLIDIVGGQVQVKRKLAKDVLNRFIWLGESKTMKISGASAKCWVLIALSRTGIEFRKSYQYETSNKDIEQLSVTFVQETTDNDHIQLNTPVLTSRPIIETKAQIVEFTLPESMPVPAVLESTKRDVHAFMKKR